MFLLIITLIVSCTVSNHSAVLDDFSCEAPCWRGISPGMSEQDATLYINQMTDIKRDSIESRNTLESYWNRAIGWTFINSIEYYGGIYFHDDRSIFMTFIYKKNIPLMNVINKFGEPKIIVIEKGILDGVMLEAYFIYPEDGICLVHSPQFLLGNPNKYLITQLTTVKEIDYYDPQLSLENIRIQCLSEFDSNLIQIWKGYGTYSVTCLNNDSRLCNW